MHYLFFYIFIAIATYTRMSVPRLFFLLLLTGIPGANAQTNYLKGYYITNSQDTIRGYIEYLSEKKNFRVCTFKKDLDGKVEKFYPEDIKGFVIGNAEAYETHLYRHRKGEQLYGFFKVMLRGKLSLLRYQSRFFAMDSVGKVHELSKRKELDGIKIRVDYSGMGMLRVLMKDCPEVSGRYLEHQYKTSTNFVEIFQKYYDCIRSPVYPNEKIVIKPHVDLGVQGVATLTRLALDVGMERVQLEDEITLSVGGFASFFIPKVNESLRVVLEATYGKYSYYAFFNSGSTNNDLFVNYSGLKVPFILRYNFKRLFFDIGFQNQFILKPEYQWRVETVQQDNVYTEYGEITPLARWSGGYLGGLGMQYKVAGHTLRSSLRYTRNFSATPSSKPVFQALEINLSFQFTR